MTDYKADKTEAINKWWTSPLGQYVFKQEQVILTTMPRFFHGYYQLQVGTAQSLLPPPTRPCKQKVMAKSADIEGESTSLPFKSHSLDTLVLSHVLEFSDDPHQVIREAERVLVSDGTLILLQFNPWSLWGLKRLFSLQDKPPWLGSFFGKTRIKDWMALLNFEVVATERLLFSPPIQNETWLPRFHFMERWGKRLWPVFSGVTVCVATKRTIPLTPIKQHWRTKQLFPRPLSPNRASRDNINE